MKLLDELSNFSDEENCAAWVLETVPLLMRVIISEIRSARPHDLSEPQFRVLGFLRHHKGVSLSFIAEHTGVSLPTMSKMIDNLVARGFIKRETSSADRRRIILMLTKRGEDVFDVAERHARERIAERLSSLPPAKRAAVTKVMKTLRSIFELSPGGAKPGCSPQWRQDQTIRE